ncbi:MAG: 5'/3'-nucleotidase SurE, partial [Holosporales bacterium]|nr:5'/3'-nucleotidase SurE [Holosporales bacterium]
MRVLISNDDGINATGIVVLEEIAKKITKEVIVCAPDSDMSGASHSLTLRSPLRLKEHSQNHYSVNGTPTDSVVMALRHILDEKKPDFVLSGINCDANLAEDIIYSGTVAAAMEGCILGIPAIAFSQALDKNGSVNWEVAKIYGPVVLKTVLEKFKFTKGVLLNINFPAGDIKDVKGIKITSQGYRTIDDHVIQSVDPRGEPYFWIGSAEYRKRYDEKDLDTDLGVINSGYVSITPLSINMTEESSLSVLTEL